MADTTPQGAPLQPAPLTLQVTDVFVVFPTVTVNCFWSPAATVADVGEMLTVTGKATVTTADPDFVESATNVAFTVTCGGLGTEAGAVYRPVDVIVPQAAPLQPEPAMLHVTAVLVVFATVAMNCCFPPRGTVAVAGDTVTDTGRPMVTDAVADLVGSATEVAVTNTCGELGTALGAV